ncbi:MAG: ATP-binding protein [Bordetella sp.]|nr:ATP-binding protein [Bordetella sp.]
MKQFPSHRSLRLRLQAGILAVLLLSWMALLAWYRAEVTRERTGEWDTNLQTVGQTAILSLPRGLENTTLPEGFTVRDQDRVPPDQTDLAIQAFALDDGRRLLSSPNAPAEPLVPSRANGLATTTADGKTWRAYAITDAEGRIQVQVGKAMGQLERELRDRMRAALLLMSALFVLLAAVAWAITYATLAPVLRLSDAVRKRAALDLEPLPAHDIPDEVQPLVIALNQQLARAETSIENERRFLQDAAHELRTPMAVLTVQAENALRSDDPEEVRESVRQIFAATQRSARMSEQLLDMARMESAGLNDASVPVDLASVAAAVAADYDTRAGRRGQTVHTRLAPSPVRGHLDSLGILLRNLIDNAVRYGRADGRIEIHCAPEADGATIVLSVRDDGPGVAEAYRDRILDRFYRAPDAQGHGSGIGLSLVARIARLHGASIEIGTGLDGRGLGITLRFPAV